MVVLPDQFAFFGDAIAYGARVGNRALNNKFGLGLEVVAEKTCRTLRTAWSPIMISIRKICMERA